MCLPVIHVPKGTQTFDSGVSKHRVGLGNQSVSTLVLV